MSLRAPVEMLCFAHVERRHCETTARSCCLYRSITPEPFQRSLLWLAAQQCSPVAVRQQEGVTVIWHCACLQREGPRRHASLALLYKEIPPHKKTLSRLNEPPSKSLAVTVTRNSGHARIHKLTRKKKPQTARLEYDNKTFKSSTFTSILHWCLCDALWT